MRNSRSRLILILPILVASAVASAVAAAPVAAQARPETVGIRIVDAPSNRADDPRARQYIVDHVAPGTTITRRVEVSNDTPSTQVIQLYAAAGSISDGNFRFADGRAANDLTTWTTVEPATVSPAPAEKTLATVTIVVPPDASPGERYGVVWAELPPAVPEGGGVAAVNRVGVRIYLSVGEGNEPASDFEVTTLEAGRDGGGNPSVTAVVHNTGGRAVDLSGELQLTNGPGGLSAGPFEARLGTTLGTDQTQPLLVPLDRAISGGPWDARMVLRSGLIEREATATITFPAAAARSSGPVATDDTDSDGLPVLAVIAAVVVLAVGVGLVRFLLRRQRRRDDGLPAPSG